MRRPIAMGFYPHDAILLERDVKKYLVSEKKINAKNALGAIVPHAGYAFSGPVAGATLKSAKTDKKTFTIFSPNHTGYGSEIAMSNDNWQTSLGVVKTDKNLIDKLSSKIKIDENAHRYEHSIEVQLPFLQMLYKDFTVVPICLSHISMEEIEEIASLFSEDSFYVASSDFIHFGPMYGYEPVDGSIDEQLKWVKNVDNELIDMICQLRAKEFYDSVISNGYTVCGFVPITLLLLVMKKIGARKGELIAYKTSYDAHPNSSFVSYAGIAFS